VALAAATGLSVLISAVRRQGVEALVAAKELADAAAVRDHLTGLANRRGLAMLGTQIVEHSRREGDAVHCVFVDVTSLANVNAESGAEAGDAVLVAVADALRGVTRATDVVARWGGDQFCVLGPGPGMPPLELERRVREHVIGHGGVDPAWPARVNAGGAMLAPWDSGTLDTLLGKADQEMHLRRALRRDATGGRTRLADPSET
jgi:diguanylate cyclase (GGDEF)-like protein